MESQKRQIVKEQHKDGGIVYRYSDFDEEIKDNLTDDLGWRFTLIIEKFKAYLDGLGDEENVCHGIVLSAIIKDSERELDEISEFISKSLGDVYILYEEDTRYNNFYSREVAGLAFFPAGRKAKEVTS